MNPWLKEQKVYALNITEYVSSLLHCTINNSTVANLYNATSLDMLCSNFKFDESNDDASEEGNEKEGDKKEENKKEGRKAVETEGTFRNETEEILQNGTEEILQNGTEEILQNGTALSFQDLLAQCELAPIDAYTELTFAYECKVSKCEAIATELNICQTDNTECDETSDNFNPDLTETLQKIGIRVTNFT